MKFKIGDKVRLNPKAEVFVYGQAGVEFNEIGEIARIRGKEIDINFPSMDYWTGREDKIVKEK